MPLLFASFANGRFQLGPAATAGQCAGHPDETIDGFPELAYTIDTIRDPEVEKKLRALARRIVASHKNQSPDRIIGFEVHGHADVDLRLPPGAERDRTEMDVSQDRADNAQEILLKMIEQEGGTPFMAGIKANTSATGFGSACRVVKPARTEGEMRKNRRVEIFLKEFHFQPPHPQPQLPAPPPGPRPPQVGTHWRIQIKSGTVTTVSVPGTDILGVATIRLNVTLIDLDRKQQASFVATAAGQTLGGSVLPSILPAGFAPARVLQGPAQDFTTRQGTTLLSFQGDLTLGQNPTAGISVVSTGGKYVMVFDALRSERTTVAVDGGNDPGTLPAFSLGVAPALGTLSMQGGVVPAP